MTPFEELVGLRAMLQLASRDPGVAAILDVARAEARFKHLAAALLGGDRPTALPGREGEVATASAMAWGEVFEALAIRDGEPKDIAYLERMWARSS